MLFGVRLRSVLTAEFILFKSAHLVWTHRSCICFCLTPGTAIVCILVTPDPMRMGLREVEGTVHDKLDP